MIRHRIRKESIYRSCARRIKIRSSRRHIGCTLLIAHIIVLLVASYHTRGNSAWERMGRGR
jgi:hypothetical protein